MNTLMLSGAAGRMGRMVASMAEAYGFTVVCGVDPTGAAYADFPIYSSFDAVREKADVLIDFSLPRALPALCNYLQSAKMPAVLCATGYGENEESAVRALSMELPVFRSANMSLGIYVLKRLAKEAKTLLPGFDIEIVEKHHSQKADAPSGTALALLDAVRAAGTEPVFGRTPQSSKRAQNEIGLHAVRGGTVAGEHEVGFYGDNETLTLTHSAQSRAVFASGALKAARFLTDKPSGLYTMKDFFAALTP